MKNFWKQLEASVIGLKHSFTENLFTWARFRITFLYFGIALLIIFIGGMVMDYLTKKVVLEVLGNTFQNVEMSMQKAIVDEVVTGIRRTTWAIRIWMIAAIAISSYLIAGLSLKPIHEALEAQKRFVANVSHELRTPLSIMKTDVETTLIDEGEVTKTEAVTSLKSSVEEIDRMSKIIEFLLNFSKFENRIDAVMLTPVSLSEIAARAVHLMKPRAEEKDIHIVFSSDTPAVIQGNITALEEMILNLLKNAIGYTPKGGAIAVTLLKDARSAATLSIQDTGIGIPAKDLPNIFEPFYKASNARLQRKTGAGLGLAIVKEIAKLHRAKIHIKSKVGEGTTLNVQFNLLGIQG